MKLSNVVAGNESQEYLAHNFQLDGLDIIYRTAKITSEKIGQFVTIWKRDEEGVTVPFDSADNFDFFIIATQQNENFGIFVFPKTILKEKKIITNGAIDGKRGIRVYPSFD